MQKGNSIFRECVIDTILKGVGGGENLHISSVGEDRQTLSFHKKNVYADRSALRYKYAEQTKEENRQNAAAINDVEKTAIEKMDWARKTLERETENDELREIAQMVYTEFEKTAKK